jgi:tRNA pseudouridine55 synthase
MKGGLLLSDKPPGWTSHDVVAALRRRLPKGVKVGHCGTLDPMATGLLVLLVGEATRRAASLQGLDKAYSGAMRLGLETDTGDSQGRAVRERPLPPLSEARILDAFRAHLGELRLPVPAYSAVKVRGRALYDYARKGMEAPRVERLMSVSRFELSDWREPEASFLVSCSSGTYIRALAVSVGERLGCGASLTALRRLRVGPYALARARPVRELLEMPGELLLERMEAAPGD